MACIILYKHRFERLKSGVIDCQIMKPMTELLNAMLESHKPVTVVFKHRLEVQAWV